MIPVIGGNNKGVVNKQLLDEVFYIEYDSFADHPYFGSVKDEAIFRQKSTDRGAHTTSNFKGPGLFKEKNEAEGVEEQDISVDNYRTTNMLTFAEDVPLSQEYIEDEEFDTIAEMVRQLAQMARVTQEIRGMAQYRDNATVNSGTSLVSNTHTTISGDTVDNRVGGVLTPTTLNDAITLLGNQANEAGVQIPRMAKTLLVPLDLFKRAVENVDSELLADSANNNLNVLASRYGINILQSPFLGAQQGGNDTYWWLLAKMHGVCRIERRGLNTDYVDAKFQKNKTAVYRADYRENYNNTTYEGVVGYIG